MYFYRPIVLCSIFLLLLNFKLALSEDQQLKPNDIELIRINEVFSKINEIYKIYGMKTIESNGGWHEKSKHDNTYYQMPEIHIIDAENAFGATFLDENHQLIAFGNGHLFDELFDSPEAKLYDKPTQPKWTQEKALGFALKLLPIFNDRSDVILAEPRIKYRPTIHRMGKTFIGTWEVYWNRTDGKGHRFASMDYIYMSIDENKGLISTNVLLPARYTEVHGKEISMENALKMAQKYAQQTTSWGIIGNNFGTGKLDLNPSGQELVIVTPNHLLQSSGLPLKDDLDAHLAWLFGFKWHSDHDASTNQGVSVWIDAHTGEYLGSDAGL